MNTVGLLGYVDIVYLTIKKKHNQDLKKINEVIEEWEVPLNWKSKVRELVLEKFRETDYKIYASFSKKEQNLIYCTGNPEPDDCFRGYIGFLEENTKPVDMKSLNNNSSYIIKNMPDPKLTNLNYQTKGLVVGQVQSGKTANIQALICKAVDAGYRFIVILSGRHNDLRSQTQDRFDDEVFSSSTQNWSRLTDKKNDFERGSHDIDSSSETAKIAIIKKNVIVMEKMIKSIRENPNYNSIKSFPFLIIDDESDDASIDTNSNDPNLDPTKTNQKIREILKLFNKTVYVGFSATPFANVFIEVNNEQDLYPKDIIHVLPTSEKYIGSRQLFDLDDEKDSVFKFVEPLSSDEEINVTDLKNSIYSFILSSCVAIERATTDQNLSMLIHPSYKNIEQDRYRAKVDEVLKDLSTFIEHPEKVDLLNEFKELWEKDFLPILDKEHSFESIWQHHKYIISNLEIKQLNHQSDDILDYKISKKIYIIIGGNILSRGLTLNGLLVSFFIRDAKRPNYDTLIQMQRWCGFHKNTDLIRIYTTEKLYSHFKDLVYIEENFRKDIKQIYDEDNNASPLDIQPKIQKHPSMRVTNPKKTGSSFTRILGTIMQKTYMETKIFYKDKKSLCENIVSVREWIKDKKISKNDDQCIKLNVKITDINRLVESYKFVEKDFKDNLKDRIQNLQSHNISDWVVEIHKIHQKNHTKFQYREDISVNKAQRGLHDKNGNLRITKLGAGKVMDKFREEITDLKKGGLILIMIDEKSNEYEHSRRTADKKTIAEAPVLGLLFIFPKIDTSNDTNQQPDRTQDRNRLK